MPTEPDPIATDMQHARRVRKTKASAVCCLCGATNPAVLRESRRSILEEHHLAGEANDASLTVTLCLNCHREQSSRQRGMGIELERDDGRTEVERLASFLRGLALFFAALASSLVAFADGLAAHLARLDADWPAWRENQPDR